MFLTFLFTFGVPVKAWTLLRAIHYRELSYQTVTLHIRPYPWLYDAGFPRYHTMAFDSDFAPSSPGTVPSAVAFLKISLFIKLRYSTWRIMKFWNSDKYQGIFYLLLFPSQALLLKILLMKRNVCSSITGTWNHCKWGWLWTTVSAGIVCDTMNRPLNLLYWKLLQ